MKKIISIIICVILTISCLASCSGETKKEGGEQTQSNEKVEVKIWHDSNDAIIGIFEKKINESLANDNIVVSFEKKSNMNDQIQLYGNDDANGPDMYFWAHDSIGTFATMGVLSPLNEICDVDDLLADAVPMTREAGKFGDVQYQLPLYFETLVFIYNKALWKGEIPNTTDGLYSYMEENTDVDAGVYALLNQHTNAYNVSPFIYGYGGYIIDNNAVPGFDNPNTIEAVRYNSKFAALQADGDYNTVTTLFNEGKSQAIIGGPWMIDGIKSAGIDYGICSLSDFSLPNGNSLSPFSGVQGICVLKKAVDKKKDALEKVLRALFTSEVGISLAKEAGCAPAHKGAYDDPDVVGNEMILAIQKTAETAQPMPNLPEMTSMWNPAENFLVAVNKNGTDVETAAKEAQEAAVQAIKDMK